MTETDYEWLTGQLLDVAARFCQGRIVSVLEGGYNLRGGVSSAFARSTAAHVRALAAGPPSGLAGYDPSDAEAERGLEKKRMHEKTQGMATPCTICNHGESKAVSCPRKGTKKK